MELIWGERQHDDVGDVRNKNWEGYTFLQKPGSNGIGVRLLVKTLEQNLRISDLEKGLRMGGVVAGVCRDEVQIIADERETKKRVLHVVWTEIKLSAIFCQLP